MAQMITYHAHVTRDGAGWHVYVPEVERVTAARHLREVDSMARDLIAGMLDLDPDSLALDVDVELPAAVRDHLDRSAALRAESARAQAGAAAEARAAARSLHEAGVPLRDVGVALGISYQRAHQLVSA